MKILLTGVTGYVGKRLIPILLSQNHELICCIRNVDRAPQEILNNPKVEVVQIDFLKPKDSVDIPSDIDVAFYLIHSMSSLSGDFEKLELETARNFRELINETSVKQVIYLGGISNDKTLSKHLRSRKNVEKELQKGNFALTILHAGIIIGSGSASFEIIRDLVEKLPVMVTPKWLNTRSQPIAIRDVLKFLTGVILHPQCLNQTFDIAGPDILTYKEILLQFASIRKLKRLILVLLLMTPRLSSYWLYFITSTSYKLAVHLVNSMKVEVIAKDNKLAEILNIQPLTYQEAVKAAFIKIEQNQVYSSWKDALSSSMFSTEYTKYIQVPTYGCYKDTQVVEFQGKVSNVKEMIWSIGGDKGWYYANFLWRLRGYFDKLVGGVGLRRGRTNPKDIQNGDALDFWRVLLADKTNNRLLLYAEMKLPGEAWLEFKILPSDSKNTLIQTATFRPKGLWGRVYWYLSFPFHIFIFRGMIRNIVKNGTKKG